MISNHLMLLCILPQSDGNLSLLLSHLLILVVDGSVLQQLQASLVLSPLSWEKLLDYLVAFQESNHLLLLLPLLPLELPFQILLLQWLLHKLKSTLIQLLEMSPDLILLMYFWDLVFLGLLLPYSVAHTQFQMINHGLIKKWQSGKRDLTHLYQRSVQLLRHFMFQQEPLDLVLQFLSLLPFAASLHLSQEDKFQEENLEEHQLEDLCHAFSFAPFGSSMLSCRPFKPMDIQMSISAW